MRRSRTEFYIKLVQDYPIVSIEDPFEQDDWEAYALLREKIGKQVQIVGDDLLVTNPARIAEAIQKKACNALLLKVNQVGSVTESVQACLDSQAAGWGLIVQERLRITILLILLWVFAQDRSRLELLADQNVCPSTISCFVLRNDSEARPSMLERTSALLIVVNSFLVVLRFILWLFVVNHFFLWYVEVL